MGIAILIFPQNIYLNRIDIESIIRRYIRI